MQQQNQRLLAGKTYLASINENPTISSPYEIGIGPLELHVSWIAAEKAHNARRYIANVRQVRQLGSLRREVLCPEASRVESLGFGG
jgi:hypothetical protein